MFAWENEKAEMAETIKVVLSRVFVSSKMSEVRRNNKNSAFFKNIDFMGIVFSSLIIKDTTTHINKVGTESCSFNLVMVHEANTPKSIYLFSEQTCKSISLHHAGVCYQVYMQAQKDYAVHKYTYPTWVQSRYGSTENMLQKDLLLLIRTILKYKRK